MFTIEMLPAERGDCLWITYGQDSDLHHVLIDGGPRETIGTLVPELERRLSALAGRRNRVELLVVTHVDADHIQGIVSLLSRSSRVALFRDIWSTDGAISQRTRDSEHPTVRDSHASWNRMSPVGTRPSLEARSWYRMLGHSPSPSSRVD